MPNQYGQTDILARYLSAQPRQHHTGLGTALRLGGAALASYGDQQAKAQRKTALADALRGFNRGMMDESGALGPQNSTPSLGNPDMLAGMLMDEATAPLAMAMIQRQMPKGPRDPIKLGPGDVLLGADNKPVYSAPFRPEKESQPSSVQEYQYAIQNGFTGTYPEFIQSKRPSTTVTNTVNAGDSAPQIGTIPKDHMLSPVRNEAGETVGFTMAVIPGSPTDRELTEAARKGESKTEDATAQTNIVIEDIDRAIEEIQNGGFPATGFAGLLDSVPGTPAFRLSNIIKGIKSNLSLNALQRMRDNSPTGGALGSVTEGELDLLSSLYGTLQTSQDGKDLLFNLNRLRREMKRVIHGSQERLKQSTPGWSIERVE